MTQRSSIPRAVLAAFRGGSGKTFITIGILAALRDAGLDVAPFKKGPDYIDAAWLGLAAGSPCYNLDAYLFDSTCILDSVRRRSEGKSAAFIEGNRGLFDGVDASGSYSTVELAKTLRAPVILAIDTTKMTRTAAALVLGCQALDPHLDVRGVILNRVGGARHEKILTQAINDATGLPILGAVRKLGMESFPQRHLGLLPLYEHPRARQFVREAGMVAKDCIDLDRVHEVMRLAGPLPESSTSISCEYKRFPEKGLRIGIVKDSAFQFYYPENLESLSAAGAQVLEISALEGQPLPPLHALYIGGGFPETHAAGLAENTVFKESLRTAVRSGLPVYAECGGLMYLSRNLVIDENTYPMAGILDVDSVLDRKPQGHGYIKAEVVGSNPFYEPGVVLTGHEFHYSFTRPVEGKTAECSFRVLRGHGIGGGRDGMVKHNVLATYVHVHALGEPRWARGLLAAAERFQRENGPDTVSLSHGRDEESIRKRP